MTDSTSRRAPAALRSAASTIRSPNGQVRRRRWIPRLALPVLLLAGALGIQLVTQRLDARAAVVGPLVKTVPYRSVEPWMSSAGDVERPLPIGFAIESGETLGSALGELGASAGDIQQIGLAMSGYVSPRELRPADSHAAWFDGEAQLVAVELTIEAKGKMAIRRQDGAWRPSWRPFARRVELHQLHGVVDGALESAIVAAGGEPAVAFKMAEVLQWDLDFNRDLRRGNRFEVIYERRFVNDRFQSVGDILALRFRNGGNWLESYRFGEDGGYYDFAGRPLRKMFLRSPVPYSRVTSSFSNRRFHPVLKRFQPHYGVDFGAPAGTPVRVTANGTVRFAGWNGGGGRTVKVGHTNGYLTAYLHLSRIAGGVAPGVRVSQGQVIGYVGATGLATAPHLDYRVQQNGRWINPMAMESKPADPVPAEQLALFEQWRDAYRHALDTGKPLAEPFRAESEIVLQAALPGRDEEGGAAEVVGR